MIWTTCSTCREKGHVIKKECIGMLLVILIIPTVWLFGINAGSVTYIILFGGVGIKWIVERTSKRYVCDVCRQNSAKANLGGRRGN